MHSVRRDHFWFPATNVDIYTFFERLNHFSWITEGDRNSWETLRKGNVYLSCLWIAKHGLPEEKSGKWQQHFLWWKTLSFMPFIAQWRFAAKWSRSSAPDKKSSCFSDNGRRITDMKCPISSTNLQTTLTGRIIELSKGWKKTLNQQTEDCRRCSETRSAHCLLTLFGANCRSTHH